MIDADGLLFFCAGELSAKQKLADQTDGVHSAHEIRKASLRPSTCKAVAMQSTLYNDCVTTLRLSRLLRIIINNNP
jgi:hypothetical protein